MFRNNVYSFITFTQVEPCMLKWYPPTLALYSPPSHKHSMIEISKNSNFCKLMPFPTLSSPWLLHQKLTPAALSHKSNTIHLFGITFWLFRKNNLSELFWIIHFCNISDQYSFGTFQNNMFSFVITLPKLKPNKKIPSNSCAPRPPPHWWYFPNLICKLMHFSTPPYCPLQKMRLAISQIESSYLFGIQFQNVLG